MTKDFLKLAVPMPIPPEDEALRQPLRAFLRERLAMLPPERRARSWSGFDADFSRELGSRGYIGVTFPKQYGGAGRSAFVRYVILEELLNIGAPVAAHWMSDRQSGPLILKYGTEEQKHRFIPAICRGESFFCIGMSEPDSGSDLSSVRTRAKPAGDRGWRLNGQKIWTTHGHRSQHMIALVRTSGEAQDRHKGLSQVLVDLSAPGVTVRPIADATGDAHFSEVFFDDVRLPADAILGTEGNGWNQVISELALERSGPERFYSSMVLLDEWLAFLRTLAHPPQSWLRLAGRLLAQLAPVRALSLSLAHELESGGSPVVEAALVKDLGTTIEQEIPTAIAAELRAITDMPLPPSLMAVANYTTLAAPSYSLRGGTRDILRGMIAQGMGLR